MDLLSVLPGLALAAGIAAPAVRRLFRLQTAERTLAESRTRVLPL